MFDVYLIFYCKNFYELTKQKHQMAVANDSVAVDITLLSFDERDTCTLPFLLLFFYVFLFNDAVHC